MHRLWLAGFGALFLCAEAPAQVSSLEASKPAPATTARVVKLTFYPAKLPVPVLKHHLLPWASALKPGNGAVFYQRAHSPEFVQHVFSAPDFSKSQEWLEQPFDKELAKKLEYVKHLGALRELDFAARCEFVDWQLSERLRQDGVALLLPDVQGFRSLASLLALRARLEMHEGRIDDAVRSLQTGLAMSRHVADSLTLINGLVGAAIGNMMFNRAEELVQMREAPNLYWAFTELPSPMIEFRRGFQGERMMVDTMLPGVRAALTALDDPRRPPIPEIRVEQALEKLQPLGINVAPLGLALQAARLYPQARQYLLDRGRTPEEIGALPVSQVVLMHQLAEYDRWSDEFYKLAALPFWQARPLFQKLELARKQAGKVGTSDLMQLLPSGASIFFAQARLDRRVALLRTIEALRYQAAQSGGKLPEKLDEIRDLPVPPDPVTGQPFIYTRQTEASATLEAPAPVGDVASAHNAVRYEITLAAGGRSK